LLPHEDPTAKLSLPLGSLERDAFDVRKFVKEHGLRTDAGGAFMWRAVWDEESSRIWRDVISEYPSLLVCSRDIGLIRGSETPEPRYGYPPKPDPYAALKELKKYA